MREAVGLVKKACEILRFLEESGKGGDKTLELFLKYILDVLSSIGITCEANVGDGRVARVAGDIVRISRVLGGGELPEIPRVSDRCTDYYCKLDSIFKELYCSAEKPGVRLRVMEAYGLLRTVFEYAFLLYLLENGLGLSIATLEITGKKEFLSSSRIPYDYGKASMLMSEAIMYVAYRSSFDEIFSPLGRWSSRRPLSIVNPYFSGSILQESYLGGLNPAILDLLAPTGRGQEGEAGVIAERLAGYLKEYWESIVDSEYVRDILGRLQSSGGGGEEGIRYNGAYGGVDDVIALLKDDVPFLYNMSVYSISHNNLKRLFEEGGGAYSKILLDLVNKEGYRIDKLRGGFMSLLYMDSALYQGETARAKVFMLPERYAEVLEASHGNVGRYRGRVTCTNCYLRPYLVWNVSENPVLAGLPGEGGGGDKVFLRMRAYERLCPLHFVIRITRSVKKRG